MFKAILEAGSKEGHHATRDPGLLAPPSPTTAWGPSTGSAQPPAVTRPVTPETDTQGPGHQTHCLSPRNSTFKKAFSVPSFNKTKYYTRCTPRILAKDPLFQMKKQVYKMNCLSSLLKNTEKNHYLNFLKISDNQRNW